MQSVGICEIAASRCSKIYIAMQQKMYLLNKYYTIFWTLPFIYSNKAKFCFFLYHRHYQNTSQVYRFQILMLYC